MVDLGETVKAAFQKVARGISVLALTSAMSGCGFYAYAHIDTRRPEGGGHAHPPPPRALVVVENPYVYTESCEAHTFAASYEDSTNPNGTTVTVGTCTPTGYPHSAYTDSVIITPAHK